METKTYLCHCPTLVIPPDQLYSLRIPKLEAGEERDGFDGMQAAVDVVACRSVSSALL